jgi:hypothetical protein
MGRTACTEPNACTRVTFTLNKVEGLYHIPMSSFKNALKDFIFLERVLESIDLSLQYELLETQATSCLLDDCYGGTHCRILWPCS